MATTAEGRTPVHLWIVGILALLWNGWGGYDYIMTKTRNMDYLSQIPGISAEEILAWVDAFPIYAQIGWGLGVWGGVLGSILLLLRSRWAVWGFALSLIGIVFGIGYQLFLAPPLAGADEGIHAVIPYAVIVVGIALFLYARAMQRKGVLR